ncbi:hypothetical protein [Nitratireductor luteus]|uniref:hypothetical protein n=1 Tax=Nitratireductor luteus TaxID=2976980 RepID=UPI00223F2043|nr:hypothetical protein [Nitratireductor luteus]
MATAAERPLRAVRATFEGAEPSLELLAEATQRSLASLQRQAERDGWNGDGPVDAGALEGRLLRLSDTLVREFEKLSRAGKAAGRFDKGRIDALNSMLRMIEKIGDMTRLPQRAADRQIKSDAEMAAALKAIDQRILMLARELASCLDDGELVAGTDGKDS